MFESLSVSTSSAFATSKHPRTALLNAHLQSSVVLAIYLIVGSSLAVLSLIGVAYTDQLEAEQAWFPYAAMAGMLLWFTAGAWVINHKKRKIEACQQAYSAYVQRHATPTIERPTVESLTSDDPWELHAFWGAQQHTARSPRTGSSHLRNAPKAWSYSQIPAAAQIPRAVPASTAALDGTSPMLDFEAIATIEGNRPLRPISLFGSVQ